MWIKDIRDYILYEDKDILVCHKPAGLAVQNARVGSMDMESLLKNYIAQKVPGKMPYLGIIHRLDQPVEGVLVFALNPKAAADLSRQMTAEICCCLRIQGSSRSQQTDDSGKNKEDLSCSYRRNSESEECKTGGLAEEGWQDQQLCSG